MTGLPSHSDYAIGSRAPRLGFDKSSRRIETHSDDVELIIIPRDHTQIHPPHHTTHIKHSLTMSIPGFDPENAQNFEEIEMQFAVKTVEHLEVRPKVVAKCLSY